MDVSKIDMAYLCDAGAVMTVKHPITKKDTDWKVKCAGIESAAYRKKSVEIRKSVTIGKPSKETWHDATNRQIDLYSSCIVSWSGLEDNGKEVECNPENIKRFMEQDWFYTQVSAFVDDLKNFFTNSGEG